MTPEIAKLYLLPLGHIGMPLGICPFRRTPEFLNNLQSKSVRKGKPSREMNKVLRKHFQKKVHKHIKRCSISGKCTVIPQNTSQTGKNYSVCQHQLEYTAGGKENCHNHFKNQLALSSKFEDTHKQDSAVPLLEELMHMCPQRHIQGYSLQHCSQSPHASNNPNVHH